MPDTDMKINYYLRQQKTIERRMFCHLFSSINRLFDLHHYQYIGMGAKYFADFLLFHREFGFKKMVSIEADNENTQKYEFNKPLNCIEMQYGYSSEVLPKLNWTETIRSIVWLDYDSQLNKSMLEDIETIISKLPSGSMFFFSFNSSWPTPTTNWAKARENFLRKKLEEYYPTSLTSKDFAEKNKHFTQCRPINNTIDNAISIRTGMTYIQLIDIIYQDGCEMTTIGGIILNESDIINYQKLDFSHLDFIITEQNTEPYSLKIPPLTYKEAIKIFEYLPCEDLSKIEIPGLTAEHIKQIAKVYRYYPFYLETSLFT
ncbi:O-methyltransferase [uncultured Acetobacterium sp.]|uniref:O-methyltransferase n=1 Tax=uncultured Acetobacterium sp. TaxID=217139 RepID=UPI0025F31774|nr:O-methyltransferase [uncultured Acetobacterium sp.]